ncbi:MAG: CBS domain-containing protein [Bacteroidales bacterium]|nr:CBS domain-containing protein [Bacteroidales bacterium]
MLAKELISDVVPAVKTSDSGAQVLNWMDHFRISHMPIVNNSDFLGLISDTDIYALDNPDEAIGNHHLSLFSPFVEANKHLYEVIELANRLKLTVIPVLNQGEDYLGVITMTELVDQFAHLISADQPGAILVFSMTAHDYSLTEIARIVEENNARILNSNVVTILDTSQVEVTIKTNKTDVSSIIRSFERYDYNIRAKFMDDAELDDMYRSKYEEFMRYLNT